MVTPGAITLSAATVLLFRSTTLATAGSAASGQIHVYDDTGEKIVEIIPVRGIGRLVFRQQEDC
jgi:hypothetical protein